MRVGNGDSRWTEDEEGGGLAGSVTGGRECWEGGVGGGMMGQMKKAGWGVREGDEEGDGWRGKILLLDCVAAPEHCPVPLQHSSASSPFVLIVP